MFKRKHSFKLNTNYTACVVVPGHARYTCDVHGNVYDTHNSVYLTPVAGVVDLLTPAGYVVPVVITTLLKQLAANWVAPKPLSAGALKRQIAANNKKVRAKAKAHAKARGKVEVK